MNNSDGEQGGAGLDARKAARRSAKAALATLEASTGAPYNSLVTVALDQAGCPIFLLSDLAWHTKNINADARASVLFDDTGGLNDPLEGVRVSYMGRIVKSDRESDARRFLARHPDASSYAEFADFSFYRLEPEQAHFIAGFGRIFTLQADAFTVRQDVAAAFDAAEIEIVEHMNDDHGDAIALYAGTLLGAPGGDWRMSGCDADGCDLLCENGRLRLEFPHTLRRPGETRTVLMELANKARSA
ncbi:MAG: HugZ family protein [Hyphomicrobiales bacterium]